MNLTMSSARLALNAAMVAAALSACASNGIEAPATAAFAPAAGPDEAHQDAAYTLASDERELDCKKMAGKLIIRILELRSYAAANNTTLLSRSLQTAGKSVLGGTSAGTDPYGDHAKDLAMVEAYNRELAARDCRSFDLAKELAPSDSTPTPTVPPPSKAAQSAAAVRPR